MWLLHLHVAISILCLLIVDGFSIICRDSIKENGWTPEKKTPFIKRILNHWILFIPFMNFIAVITTFLMISMKKEDFVLWGNNRKK